MKKILLKGLWYLLIIAVVAYLATGIYLIFTFFKKGQPSTEPTAQIEEVTETVTTPISTTTKKTTTVKKTVPVKDTQQQSPTGNGYMPLIPVQTQPAPVIKTKAEVEADAWQASSRLVCYEMAQFFNNTVSPATTNYSGCVSSYKRNLNNFVNTYGKQANPEYTAKLEYLNSLGY